MRILRTLPARARPVRVLAGPGTRRRQTPALDQDLVGLRRRLGSGPPPPADLGEGSINIYLVTLYAARVQFQVYDKSVNNIDLVLHDEAGKELARDESNDREPDHQPTATQTYYVAVYAADLSDESKVETAGVAMAVTYK